MSRLHPEHSYTIVPLGKAPFGRSKEHALYAWALRYNLTKNIVTKPIAVGMCI